jgi:hypothetical protein
MTCSEQQMRRNKNGSAAVRMVKCMNESNSEITAASSPDVAREAGREASPPSLDPSPPSTGIIPSALSLIERIARGWPTWPPPCAAS